LLLILVREVHHAIDVGYLRFHQLTTIFGST
jgi:hypothetical protein